MVEGRHRQIRGSERGFGGLGLLKEPPAPDGCQGWRIGLSWQGGASRGVGVRGLGPPGWYCGPVVNRPQADEQGSPPRRAGWATLG